MSRKSEQKFLATLTDFEWALLRHLAELHGCRMVAVFREALRVYASHSPRFHGDAFTSYVEREVLPDLGSKERRDAASRELATFLSTLGASTPAGPESAESLPAIADAVFDSRSDFETEE